MVYPRSSNDDDEERPWISKKDRALLVNKVRDARSRLDTVERAQVTLDDDATSKRRWNAWHLRVHLAAARAEMEEWRAIAEEVFGQRERRGGRGDA